MHWRRHASRGVGRNAMGTAIWQDDVETLLECIHLSSSLLNLLLGIEELPLCLCELPP